MTGKWHCEDDRKSESSAIPRIAFILVKEIHHSWISLFLIKMPFLNEGGRPGKKKVKILKNVFSEIL